MLSDPLLNLDIALMPPYTEPKSLGSNWGIYSEVRWQTNKEVIPSHHILIWTGENQDRLVCSLIDRKCNQGVCVRLLDPEMNPPHALRDQMLYVCNVRARCLPSLIQDPHHTENFAITFRPTAQETDDEGSSVAIDESTLRSRFNKKKEKILQTLNHVGLRFPLMSSPKSLESTSPGWGIFTELRSEETEETIPFLHVLLKKEERQDQLICQIFNRELGGERAKCIPFIDLERGPQHSLRDQLIYTCTHRCNALPYLKRDPQTLEPLAVTFRPPAPLNVTRSSGRAKVISIIFFTVFGFFLLDDLLSGRFSRSDTSTMTPLVSQQEEGDPTHYLTPTASFQEVIEDVIPSVVPCTVSTSPDGWVILNGSCTSDQIKSAYETQRKLFNDKRKELKEKGKADIEVFSIEQQREIDKLRAAQKESIKNWNVRADSAKRLAEEDAALYAEIDCELDKEYQGQPGYVLQCRKIERDILGVKPWDNCDKIGSQFRQLSLQYHPDKNSSAEAKEKFLALNAAHETLCGSQNGQG